MIIDSSAIIAILHNEGDAASFAHAIADSPRPKRLSAAGYLETAIVLDRANNPVASRKLDDFLSEASITIESVTEAQVKLARQAYRDFGRGSGHPAGLNFGDCFAYALAKDKGERLLFKGNDFLQTDIAGY